MKKSYAVSVFCKIACERGHNWVPPKKYLITTKAYLTGEIVGYSMDSRMIKSLVSRSLFKVISNKRPGSCFIYHSDRGSQYCSLQYRKVLDQFGMKSSMSRKGNCFYNAPMESFRGTLKQEIVHHRRYATRTQAIDDITEYIEVFYNRQR